MTDFSGIISDESVQGIRFRKGNILVGNNTTFVKYFPSEGHNANRMFAGEIHALHADLIPNYREMTLKLMLFMQKCDSYWANGRVRSTRNIVVECLKLHQRLDGWSNVIELNKNWKKRLIPKSLQYIMGHADISMTLNTYTHVKFEDAEAEMKRVAAI